MATPDVPPSSDVAPELGADVQTSDAATDITITDVTGDVTGDRPFTPDATGAPGLVINEVRADGDEWVELHNTGSAPIDISNLQLADTEADGGGPRLSRRMRFTAGTTLGPGQYMLVVANQSDAGVGPQTTCLDGGPSMCFHANWSLSASRGETVYVLDPSNAVIIQQLYPMNVVADGQTYGRIPNGTGPFVANRPTPGAANVAP